MECIQSEKFALAVDLINNTSRSLFLTGKAGTGKTTFLHYIRNKTDKKIIVSAPTGVAAINAGGVTLHSLFQLPFEPFIPDVEGKRKLELKVKMRRSKIELFRELELLVIDEVSMLRADMLDAIDTILRRFRNRHKPFGGVQMLFIGDLFQLPPVVQPEDRELLEPFYPSPFFFHARVFLEYEPLHIELDTVYRQSERVFVEMLNRIRNNRITDADIQRLNMHYNPNFSLSGDNRYIVLTTHNYQADKINENELQRLPGKEYVFKGKVTGEFPDTSLPVGADLKLKPGARVMFTRNEGGERSRYYNGKLATVVGLTSNSIMVRFEDATEMEAEPEVWKNIRYTLNADSGEILEEEIGSYSQFPLRLAWAITIHKSQGLTFDHVIIDAGRAFAAGQVYVAFSRCTSLDGIVLFSKIRKEAILTHEENTGFSQEETAPDKLREIVESEKPAYCAGRLKKAFDWRPVVKMIFALKELIESKNIPNRDRVSEHFDRMARQALQQQEVALRFAKELDVLLVASNADRMKERVQKAVLYFHREIRTGLLLPLDTHIQQLARASKIKQYLRAVKEIRTGLAGFLMKLENIRYGNVKLTEGLTFEQPEVPLREEPLKEPAKKNNKGDSFRLTLELFHGGKSAEEIARERNLAVSTIESHFIRFIETGEIPVYALVAEERVETIRALLNEAGSDYSLSSLKTKLGDDYSYTEIKAVINHVLFLKKQ
jgi:PIF1 helicase.